MKSIVKALPKIKESLERAKTPAQSKKVESTAAASMAWAKEQGDYELFVESWYTYVLARRKTTELCRPFVEHSGNGSNQYESKGDTRVTLADIGFTKKQWNRRDQELEIPLEKVNEYYDRIVAFYDWHPSLAGLVKFHTGISPEAARERREKEAKRLEQQTNRFPVVLADPAWEYDFSVSDSRAIENHYWPSSIDEMKKLTPPATTDAVLFMCATSPKLPEALELMEAWGFEYKTCMVWVKDKIGTGYYARQKHELVLIGTKGEGLELPDPGTRPESVFYAPRGKHSEKPEKLYEVIETMYPSYGKYEVFLRKVRNGWEGWGDES